jgi:hypothetical protein
VEELSNHIAANFGNMRGFSPQNIWRMKQFYETYKDSQILSALLRELSWTNNLLVMGRAKSDVVLVFYLYSAVVVQEPNQSPKRSLSSLRWLPMNRAP